MAAHSLDTNAVLERMHGRKVPAGLLVGGAVAIVIGIAGFVYGLVASPAWAWGAYLSALLWILAVAQGGLLFAVMMTLTWGRWGQPLKRIGEAFGFFLPIGYLLLLVFLLAGNGIYPWHEGTILQPVDIQPHSPQAIATKPIWLNLPFFIGRHVVGFGILLLLDFLYLRASLRPDLIQASAFLRQKFPGWNAPRWWGWLGDTGNLEHHVRKGQHRQSVLGVLITIAFVTVFSLLAFDLVMSLSPWWYSNMFGGWFFASSFWLGLAGLGIYGLVARDWLGIEGQLTSRVTHDLGKLTLAFCMFWAYTLFAQILPIWYANMPEETMFLLVRMRLPEWAWLARTVGVLCFLTPFTVLASRGIKKMKWPFIGILSIIAIGMFLERTLLVMPSVWFGEFPVDLFLLVSIPLWIGFIGAFALVVTAVLAKLPPLPISDPAIHPHPWDIHVHALAEVQKHREMQH